MNSAASGRILTSRATVPGVLDPALERRLRRAAEKFDRDRAERDALIVEAIASGASYREVAKTVGISHPTVMTIVAAAKS